MSDVAQSSVATETLYRNQRDSKRDPKRDSRRAATQEDKRPCTSTASCIAYSESPGPGPAAGAAAGTGASAGDGAEARGAGTPRSVSGDSDDSVSESELTRVTSRSSWGPALSVPPARLREIERDNRALLVRINAARSGRRVPPPPAFDARLSSAAINRRRLEARIAEENMRIMHRLQRVKSTTDTSSPWVFAQRRPF